MTSRDFCCWLQGYLEIAAAGTDRTLAMNTEQVLCVQRHLALVFKHEIDPSMGDAKHQAALNETHGGPAFGPHPGHDGLVMRC